MPLQEQSRISEIDAEINTLSKEGERIISVLEELKTQYEKKLISRHHFSRTVQDAKKRLMQIDSKIPLLMEERERILPSFKSSEEKVEAKKELPFKAETNALVVGGVSGDLSMFELEKIKIGLETRIRVLERKISELEKKVGGKV